MTIEPILIDALRSLVSGLNASQAGTPRWIGREREIVNLYVFSHLCPRVKPRLPLFDIAQIAIEVAVKQISSDPRRKAVVCKDLVIWPRPAMTCWDDRGVPANIPLAVIEFKCRRARGSLASIAHDRHDLAWLAAYTRVFPGCIGLSVAAAHAEARWALSILRVDSGAVGSTEILS